MDEFYIQKILTGDTESFRYLIKTYKDLAFSVAISVVKDEFWAEEVVQEAFVKVFQKLKWFNGRSSFKTWFYRIVINEAFQRLRSEKLQLTFSAAIEDNRLDEVNDEIHGMSKDEITTLVHHALKIIPPKESLALRLFYLEGQDSKTISDETGWSDANVRVILHRARKNMLACMKNLMKEDVKKSSV